MTDQIEEDGSVQAQNGLKSGKGRLLAPISKEEFENCKKGVPIHKHWHKEGGIVEFYIIDVDREELEGNLRDHVSPSTPQTFSLSVIPLDMIEWQEFVSKAEEGHKLIIPQHPDPEDYQFVLFPESFKEEFLGEEADV